MPSYVCQVGTIHSRYYRCAERNQISGNWDRYLWRCWNLSLPVKDRLGWKSILHHWIAWAKVQKKYTTWIFVCWGREVQQEVHLELPCLFPTLDFFSLSIFDSTFLRICFIHAKYLKRTCVQYATIPIRIWGTQNFKRRLCFPWPRIKHSLGRCPDWESNLQPFWCTRWCSNPLSNLTRAKIMLSWCPNEPNLLSLVY